MLDTPIFSGILPLILSFSQWAMLVLMKVSYPSVPYKLLFPFFPSVFYVSEFSHMCDLCCLLILKVSKVAQSSPTLCDPMDCSLPGSSIHGIFQARVLEWVAISFSRGSPRPRDRTSLQHCRQTLYRLSH